MKDKIIYKGLGHKLAFKNWSIIFHFKSGKIEILTVSKKVYNCLKLAGFSEEG